MENGRIGKDIIADSSIADLLDGPTIVFWPLDLRIKTYYKCIFQILCSSKTNLMIVARNLGYNGVFPGFLFLANAGHKLEVLKMLSGTFFDTF